MKVINDFLDKREDFLLSENERTIDVGRFNSSQRLKASMARLERDALDIKRAIDFYSEITPEVMGYIDLALDKLEKKVDTVRDAVLHMSKVNLLMPESSRADIGKVDLTEGTFSGLSFSISDGGIILDSDNEIFFEVK